MQAIAPESRAANKNRYLEQVRNARKNASQDWFGTWEVQNPSPWKDTPVFQVSFPRSGTTLLDQILDSHPALQVMEEEPIISEIIREISMRPERNPDSMATFNQHDIDIYRKGVAGKILFLHRGRVGKLLSSLQYLAAVCRLMCFPLLFLFAPGHCLNKPCDICQCHAD